MARKDMPQSKQMAKASVERTGELMHPFSFFRNEMDRLMEEFFGRFDLQPFGRRTETFVPQIDVVDTDKEIKVSVELAGIDEKDIDVSITRDALTIRGEKKEEKDEQGKDYYRSERSFGSFTRTIPLPVEIQADKVSASFKKGVLTVRLPKTKQTVEGTKKITIKAE